MYDVYIKLHWLDFDWLYSDCKSYTCTSLKFDFRIFSEHDVGQGLKQLKEYNKSFMQCNILI